jgi:two-component system sensor histidine kinase LytS
MSRRPPDSFSNPIQRAFTDWLRTPFRFEPDVTPSDLLVSLLQGRPDGGDASDTVLDMLVEALPQLRGGLRPESAEFTARLLYENLKLDAAAVVSRHHVLAFVGRGSDHHRAGGRGLTGLTRRSLASGEVIRTRDRAAIGCRRPDCPLASALIAPLVVRDQVVGALKLYHKADRPVLDHDERIAAGLARVFGVYLELAELDARAALATRAELDALRAQISPHFLFNTLTTIAALTRIDADRAHDLILDFAEFFRETLTQRSELSTLRDELQYVERYLRFEQARLGDRLRVEYDVEPLAADALLPTLTVQPLVENAIVHGIAPKGSGGTLRVVARVLDGGFEVSVWDDGIGMHQSLARASDAPRPGAGVAVNNIRHRLVGLFGPRSDLEIRSAGDAGTTARFWVPSEPAEQEAH